MLEPRRADRRGRGPARAEGRCFALPQGSRSAVLRVRAGLRGGGGRGPRGALRSVRLAMGGVAHKPWRADRRRICTSWVRLDDIEALGAAIATSFIELAHSPTTLSRSNFPTRGSARARDRGSTRMINRTTAFASDGRLKVTGAARYAPIFRSTASHTPRSSTAPSPTVESRRSTPPPPKSTGVGAVFTHHNMPRMNPTPSRGAIFIPTASPTCHCRTTPSTTPASRSRWWSPDTRSGEHAGTPVRSSTRPSIPWCSAAIREGRLDPPPFLWPVTSAVGDADAASPLPL